MTATIAPHPLPAVPEQFLDRIRSACDAGTELDAYVQQIDMSRFRSVHLLGCGGSLFTFSPLLNILDRLPIPVFAFNSSEFILRRPALLGQDALVVVSSSNGTTAETAAAAVSARQAGATVVGITQNADSVVAHECDQVFAHQGVEAKQVLLARLGLALLNQFASARDYSGAVRALNASPESFLRSITDFDDQLAAMAAALHDEPIVYVLGSGPLAGAAQTLAMCYLQEMQWRHAVAIGAGEFLHGPFEVVTDEVPVLVLKSEGPTRAMAERAERFLARHTPKLHVMDASRLSLPDIDAAMRPLIGDLVLGSTVLNRTAEHFQSWTGHSLKDRRYMWQVEY